MTNLTNSDQNVFQKLKDSEFVLQLSTGLMFLTQRGMALELGVPSTTFRGHLTDARAEFETAHQSRLHPVYSRFPAQFPIDGIVKSAGNNTSQVAKLFNSMQLAELCLYYNDRLSQRFIHAGAELYLQRLAIDRGYLPESYKSVHTTTNTQLQTMESRLHKEAPGLIPTFEYYKQPLILTIADLEESYTVAEYLSEIRLELDLTRKQRKTLARRAGTLLRMLIDAEPGKRQSRAIGEHNAIYYYVNQLYLLENLIPVVVKIKG